VLINSLSVNQFGSKQFTKRGVPKGVLEKIDYFQSRLFWQNDSQEEI
jgi:hypothetical protein